MDVIIRPAKPEDAEACGQICYDAFSKIAEQHNFPPDWPSVEVATGFVTSLLSHPEFYGVVAEDGDGRILGSNFLDERASVIGLGPITIDPGVQNASIGRKLMEHALERASSQDRRSVCLVQAGFHNRSLCLYSKLGFEVREPLSCIQGKTLDKRILGYVVRAATEADLAACGDLCQSVHGYERSREFADAIQTGTATVVEREGRITGFATMIGFGGYAVGESNDELKALISGATEFPGPGFLVPTRNGDLFRWCLEQGLRVVQPMTYMSIGPYREPQGAYLPSVLL